MKLEDDFVISSAIGDIDRVNTMILDGVDVDCVSGQSRSTALIRASFWCRQSVVRLLLLNYYIDVNAQDILGNTALIMSAWRGHNGITNMLLGMHRIDTEIKDKESKTALDYATLRGNESIVDILTRAKNLEG